jgi:pyruvate/2-oxoglutarate dehydrogenase complex dihydrolipoamide dehydrogenase (E3) component
MARAGHWTVVVERRWVGGSCPNINCLPSKNEIWSAKVAALVRRAAEFGMVTSPGSVDMARVLQRKREMVEGLIAMHLEHYRASGAELMMGTGCFVAPRTLEVQLNAGGTRVLVGTRVSLNVGTHATMPNIPGLAATASHTAGIGLDVAGVAVDARGYMRVNDRCRWHAARPADRRQQRSFAARRERKLRGKLACVDTHVIAEA